MYPKAGDIWSVNMPNGEQENFVITKVVEADATDPKTFAFVTAVPISSIKSMYDLIQTNDPSINIYDLSRGPSKSTLQLEFWLEGQILIENLNYFIGIVFDCNWRWNQTPSDAEEIDRLFERFDPVYKLTWAKLYSVMESDNV